MRIELYQPIHKLLWDSFIEKSKNGHFQFYRDYMEYHQDRFKDYSLLIRDEKNDILALLPAHKSGSLFASHQGLTYGGIVTSNSMKVPIMVELFKDVLTFLRKHGFKQFIYKTIPYIHHQQPSEEDRYALFLNNAKLYRRNIFSVVSLKNPLPFQERRVRSIKKAKKANLSVRFTDDFPEYWQILSETLMQSHNVKPVHTLEEIYKLKTLFQNNIKLCGCFLNNELIAGVLTYETKDVLRSQYIAASVKGKDLGSLDLIFSYLLENADDQKVYFDFGPSDERDGYYLNRGLIDQKEGFGARAVAHDHYQIDLS